MQCPLIVTAVFSSTIGSNYTIICKRHKIDRIIWSNLTHYVSLELAIVMRLLAITVITEWRGVELQRCHFRFAADIGFAGIVFCSLKHPFQLFFDGHHNVVLLSFRIWIVSPKDLRHLNIQGVEENGQIYCEEGELVEKLRWMQNKDIGALASTMRQNWPDENMARANIYCTLASYYTQYNAQNNILLIHVLDVQL